MTIQSLENQIKAQFNALLETAKAYDAEVERQGGTEEPSIQDLLSDAMVDLSTVLDDTADELEGKGQKTDFQEHGLCAAQLGVG